MKEIEIPWIKEHEEEDTTPVDIDFLTMLEELEYR